MLAFGLRTWANKIFDTLGKPLEKNNLVDAVAELLNVWDKGKSSNKLSFKFQTPEEGKLCKALIKTFKLDKLANYNDISSLKDARFAITSAYLEEKGYPMWSLKYMDDNFCQAHPSIILNDKIRRLFDNVVTICAQLDIKNPALIKDTLELIEEFRADLPDILAKPGNFSNGFKNFMLSQQGIGLQETEIDIAYDYIKKHLQSTVGYWSEDEVAIALKDWRIAEHEAIENQRRKEEEERRRADDELRRQKAEEERKRLEDEAKNAKEQAFKELKGDELSLAKKKILAKEIIDSATEKELYEMLSQVINLDYEFIVDKIIESVHK